MFSMQSLQRILITKVCYNGLDCLLIFLPFFNADHLRLSYLFLTSISEMFYFCKFGGFRGGVIDDSGLLGCDVASLGRMVLEVSKDHSAFNFSVKQSSRSTRPLRIKAVCPFEIQGTTQPTT